jgi:hypothetical protein
MATFTVVRTSGLLNASNASSYVGGSSVPTIDDDVVIDGGSGVLFGSLSCASLTRRSSHTGRLGTDLDPLALTVKAGGHVTIEGSGNFTLTGTLRAARLYADGDFNLPTGSAESLDAGGRSTIRVGAAFSLSGAPIRTGRSRVYIAELSETMGAVHIGPRGRVETPRLFAGGSVGPGGTLLTTLIADLTAAFDVQGGVVDWRSTVLTPGAAFNCFSGMLDFSKAPGNVTLNSPVLYPNFPAPKEGPSNTVTLSTPTEFGSREGLMLDGGGTL